jgi:hypothetical protein
MDDRRFDALARSLTRTSERRSLLRGVAATTLALAVTRISGVSGTVAARHKKKHKKKTKLVRNAFGCVDVGGKCRGNDANCCSGICQGKKPKKGKPDKSHCVAHNVLGCQVDQDACVEFPAPCGTNGFCYRTTGNASFCGGGGGSCVVECSNDADCAESWGPGSACIVCVVGCAYGHQTACKSPASA